MQYPIALCTEARQVFGHVPVHLCLLTDVDSTPHMRSLDVVSLEQYNSLKRTSVSDCQHTHKFFCILRRPIGRLAFKLTDLTMRRWMLWLPQGICRYLYLFKICITKP